MKYQITKNYYLLTFSLIGFLLFLSTVFILKREFFLWHITHKPKKRTVEQLKAVPTEQNWQTRPMAVETTLDLAKLQLPVLNEVTYVKTVKLRKDAIIATIQTEDLEIIFDSFNDNLKGFEAMMRRSKVGKKAVTNPKESLFDFAENIFTASPEQITFRKSNEEIQHIRRFLKLKKIFTRIHPERTFITFRHEDAKGFLFQASPRRFAAFVFAEQGPVKCHIEFDFRGASKTKTQQRLLRIKQVITNMQFNEKTVATAELKNTLSQLADKYAED